MLTKQQFIAAAQPIRCEPAVLDAFTRVESNGNGFLPAPDGRCVLRFEAHKFYEYWGQQNTAAFAEHFKFDSHQRWLRHQAKLNRLWIHYHTRPDLEWQAFELAKSLDEHAAMRSISLGLFQVLGDNWKDCQSASLQEWFYDHCESEERQLELTLRLIKTWGLEPALRQKDFLALATRWNGKGKRHDYASKLAAAYQQAAKLY